MTKIVAFVSKTFLVGLLLLNLQIDLRLSES
jgi:hypothetical protein